MILHKEEAKFHYEICGKYGDEAHCAKHEHHRERLLAIVVGRVAVARAARRCGKQVTKRIYMVSDMIKKEDLEK